jgi:hypothetical protein
VKELPYRFPKSLYVFALLTTILVVAGCGSVQSPIASSEYTSNEISVRTTGIHCSRVVLKDLRSSYDQGSLQQIHDYVSNYLSGISSMIQVGLAAENYVPEDDAGLPSLPQSLELKSGASACNANYSITNTGNQPVQILSVGLTFTAPTQSNTTKYNLIDLCSVIEQGCLFGGNPPCSSVAEISLSPGQAAAHVDGPIRGELFGQPSPDCDAPTLAPGKAVDVRVHITSTAPNTIYSAAATVSVSSASGSHAVDLGSSTTLAFADASLETCYQLSGNTFAPTTGQDGLCA